MKFQKILSATKKNIIVRVDLNVPTYNNRISDNSKIIVLKKTLTDLITKNNKVFLLTHFRRPCGSYNSNYSVEFLAEEIKNILNISNIYFVNDCIGSKVKETIFKMNYGEICLLENVRFHKKEEENDLNFSKKLSQNFDIYINDAFSASHRIHASIVGITKFLPSYGGLLFEKELMALNNVLKVPKKPIMAIIGGSKISTKISLLENLVTNLDYLVIAGGMANTFLASQGYNLGKSTIETNLFDKAIEIQQKAKKFGCKIILPIDLVTASSMKNAKDTIKSSLKDVNDEHLVLDIGPDSCNALKNHFSEIKTVFWNGPLGAFEYKPFDHSTKDIAQHLAMAAKNSGLTVVVGGGDTIAALRNINVLDKYTHVSTSGGAFFEFLEGKILPGIKALEENSFT